MEAAHVTSSVIYIRWVHTLELQDVLTTAQSPKIAHYHRPTLELRTLAIANIGHNQDGTQRLLPGRALICLPSSIKPLGSGDFIRTRLQNDRFSGILWACSARRGMLSVLWCSKIAVKLFRARGSSSTELFCRERHEAENVFKCYWVQPSSLKVFN